MVNILYTAEEEKENIWKIIRKIRKNYLLAYVEVEKLQWGKRCDDFIPKFLVQDHMDKIEKDLNMNISINLHENIEKETLDLAAQMFIYINFCPDENYLLFLKDLFKKDSLQNMLLSLSSIKKTTQNAVKKSSSLILNMLLRKFSLCHFKRINELTLVNILQSSQSCEMKLKDNSSGII